MQMQGPSLSTADRMANTDVTAVLAEHGVKLGEKIGSGSMVDVYSFEDDPEKVVRVLQEPERIGKDGETDLQAFYREAGVMTADLRDRSAVPVLYDRIYDHQRRVYSHIVESIGGDSLSKALKTDGMDGPRVLGRVIGILYDLYNAGYYVQDPKVSMYRYVNEGNGRLVLLDVNAFTDEKDLKQLKRGIKSLASFALTTQRDLKTVAGVVLEPSDVQRMDLAELRARLDWDAVEPWCQSFIEIVMDKARDPETTLQDIDVCMSKRVNVGAIINTGDKKLDLLKLELAQSDSAFYQVDDPIIAEVHEKLREETKRDRPSVEKIRKHLSDGEVQDARLVASELARSSTNIADFRLNELLVGLDLFDSRKLALAKAFIGVMQSESGNLSVSDLELLANFAEGGEAVDVALDLRTQASIARGNFMDAVGTFLEMSDHYLADLGRINGVYLHPAFLFFQNTMSRSSEELSFPAEISQKVAYAESMFIGHGFEYAWNAVKEIRGMVPGLDAEKPCFLDRNLGILEKYGSNPDVLILVMLEYFWARSRATGRSEYDFLPWFEAVNQYVRI